VSTRLTEFGLSDTPDEIAQLQADLLRQAGPRKRAAMAAAMTAAAVKRSRQAISRAHPEWSELEVKFFWAEVHYGKELADRVRAYIARRSQK
jgi:hypothetical protein